MTIETTLILNKLWRTIILNFLVISNSNLTNVNQTRCSFDIYYKYKTIELGKRLRVKDWGSDYRTSSWKALSVPIWTKRTRWYLHMISKFLNDSHKKSFDGFGSNPRMIFGRVRQKQVVKNFDKNASNHFIIYIYRTTKHSSKVYGRIPISLKLEFGTRPR